MTPHKLMLKVADWVEKHPERYGFFVVAIPTSAKGYACLLGWAAYFGKMKKESIRSLDDVARKLGFPASGDFYLALDDLHVGYGSWHASGSSAARALRGLVKAQEKEAKQKAKQLKKEAA